MRCAPDKILVCLLLIFKTAHKTSARTRNFRRIKRQTLLFCHFYRNGFKLAEIQTAAERTSANAYSAEHFCLVAHADLTKFNSRFEKRRQIAHQFAKINSSVGGEIKQNFVVVECIFNVDKLHCKLVFFYFFNAFFKCLFFLFLVVQHNFYVVVCRFAQNFFKRRNNFVLADFFVCKHNRAEFHTA